MILTDETDRKLIHAALAHFEKTKAYKGRFDRVHVCSMKAQWFRRVQQDRDNQRGSKP